MKSIFNGKNWVILLALISLGGLIALSSSLGEMEFELPTVSLLERFFNRPTPVFLNQPIGGSWSRYVFVALLVLAFLLYLLPIRPQANNKNLLKQIFRVALFALITLYFLGRMAVNNTAIEGEDSSVAPPALTAAAAPQPYSPPQ